MDLSSVFHAAKSAMAYAYDSKTIHLRLKAKKGLLKSVTLMAGDPFQYHATDETFEWVAFAEDTPLTLEATTATHDIFFIAITPPFKRVKYAFILDDRYLFGTKEIIDLSLHPTLKRNLFNYFNFPYLLDQDRFQAPEWMKHQIWYSIFPSRFNRHSDAPKDPTMAAWDDLKALDNQKRYGGTIQGISEKMGYLKDMGFTALYLTPLFKASTQHKYDTVDYYQIDPEFGTNDDLKTMVQVAHEHGIKVVLDAVFNHTSVAHPFFQDVLTQGKDSPYYEYYTILDETKPVLPFDLETLKNKPYKELKKALKDHDLNYLAFGFTPFMPKINCDHPEVRDYFLDVTRYWMEFAQIDGWRLDVSNEVSHDFWRAFRHTVKSINPDAAIIGENWDNSNPWLQGDQYDAVMNYGLLFPVWQTFGHVEGMPSYNAKQFCEAVNQVLTAYPKHVSSVMYNLVDSHDTSRLLSLTEGNVDRFKQSYLFLYAMPGSPSVFYGDEAGLDGGHDPLNRKPMPWHALDESMLEWFKWLNHFRQTESAFQSDTVRMWHENDQIHMTRGDLWIILNGGADAPLITPESYQRIDTTTRVLHANGYAILKRISQL